MFTKIERSAFFYICLIQINCYLEVCTSVQVNQKEKKESNFVNNRQKKIKMLGYMHFVAKLF